MSVSTAQEMAISSSEVQQAMPGAGAAELAVPAPAEPAGARRSTQQVLSGAAIRLLDLVVAVALLVVLLPLIVSAVIAIRLESPGPALVRCDRVGYQGRRLRMLKFRKMCHQAQGPALTVDGDPRFTRLGRVLSRLKIDEIPQLYHVLRGEMSLVGPRPEAAEFVGLHLKEYAQILSVPPGITGLSQIAFLHERRILDPDDPVTPYVGRILPQKVALDRLYASRRSLSLNVRILFWTGVTLLLRCPLAVQRDSAKMKIRGR